MVAIAVVGAQWGDEGKGKIIDMLAQRAKLVVRYSGGDNAGHTVINHLGEFKLHLIPSGIFYPHTTCLITNGVVINPKVLLREMDELQKRGVDISRLFISDRAHLIMPYHILLDGLEEEALGAKAVGTTRKGVGPAFTDKTARLGIRTGDLLNKDTFYQRLSLVLERKNRIITGAYGAEPLALEEVYQTYCAYAERLKPHIRETTSMIDNSLKNKELVLAEGAQGALLDPDFGTYPYNTSSSPTAGGACTGAGISPVYIKHILAVYKAYCTRVGGGPMPTELKDQTGEKIRKIAHEFGTTTGRPRRCGWFDGVAAAFSSRINGFTGISLTRLDVLDSFPKIKICTAYRLEGRTVHEFPARVEDLEKCEPVYEEMDGWMSCTGDILEYRRLPA
ncbi:MAG TPA: adenylosuccinate synthase, partial [Dehalococcoidales bacterium]|nr:adenylosuccinate synthase [Dehalococcoidales bacterium]